MENATLVVKEEIVNLLQQGHKIIFHHSNYAADVTCSYFLVDNKDLIYMIEETPYPQLIFGVEY